MRRRILRDRSGRSVYPIGVNYWPRRTAVEMWSKWDPEGIAKDLQEMRSLGLNTVRFFLRTEEFADADGNVKPTALEKLDAFLNLCREYKLYALPSFFVGHMSGMNFPIPWEQGRDFYSDPDVLACSRRFVQAIVSRYQDEDVILGWLLSNEITNHAGKRETHIMLNWMREMRAAIREIDQQRPIAPGDGGDDLKGEGLGYPELLLQDIEELNKGEDFVSLHHYYGIYYGDGETLRFSHAPAAMVRLCDIGLPVLMEEFGVSTALWSEQVQADYFRVLLFSSWAVGAAGALAWCWSDFCTTSLPPYTHHPHELFFGITHADGSRKPAAEEISRFAHLMQKIDATSWSPAPSQAAILVPQIFYVNYPFRRVDRARLREILLETYTLVRMAGFDAIFVREQTPLPEGVRLLLVPWADLLSPTWERLRHWVEQGGVLWAGFSNAIPNLEKLFGVQVDNPQPVSQNSVFFKMVEPFGKFHVGDRIELPTGKVPHLPITVTTARTLATDSAGRPAITVNSSGKGEAYFCSRPVEAMLAMGGKPDARAYVYRLYHALEAAAKITQPFTTTQPTLGLYMLESDTGAQLLLAINHSTSPLEGKIACQQCQQLLDIETGEEIYAQQGMYTILLPPWGIRIMKTTN